jgi:hypothetical protein
MAMAMSGNLSVHRYVSQNRDRAYSRGASRNRSVAREVDEKMPIFVGFCHARVHTMEILFV